MKILKIEEFHSHMRQKSRNAKRNSHIASARPWGGFPTATGRASVDFASSKMTALSHGALEDSADSAHAEHAGDFQIIKSAERDQQKHVDLEGFDFHVHHVLCKFIRICVAFGLQN